MLKLVCLLSALFVDPAFAGMRLHGSPSIPTADVVCDITNGICIGAGGGSSLFTAATCDGVADDRLAFISFNDWAVNTWQASHSGLIQLSIPSGKSCQFIAGNVNSNKVGQGLRRFQIVGYGATMGDGGGVGGGFALGAFRGVFFDGTASTARLATVAAGSSTITLLDTAKCSLLNNGDTALVAGIDPQGGGDPPNPQIYEYVVINSTAACAGSGVLTLATPLTSSYKSTWPLYNPGNAFQSDQGGPGTIYQMDQTWVTAQAFYGLTLDQSGTHTNALGKDITFRDITIPGLFGVIPSQNQIWRATNLSAPNATSEFDKIVESVVMENVTYRRIFIQSGADPKSWSCTNCTIGPVGVAGTTGNTTFINSNIAALSLGPVAYGISASFSATNTVISDLSLGGASLTNIDTRGIWSSGTLTVPANLRISSAADNGSGLIRLTVTSTAGWTTGITGEGQPGSNCAGIFPVTVIDGTHVDLQGSTFIGTCTQQFGSLPLTWAVPGGYVYFGGGNAPWGPILQVADLAVGPNDETIVSFNLNGSPYAGGFPVMPGGPWSITSFPAASWSCVGCTGPINVTDLALPSASGLPFGSYVSRTVTAANNTESNSTGMLITGLLTEVDITVSAACSGASNFTFNPFYQILGNATQQSGWAPTVNGLVANPSPRIITPTGASGAQSGDVLSFPGASSWMLGLVQAGTQIYPHYTNVGNCGSASTTITFQTDLGIVP